MAERKIQLASNLESLSAKRKEQAFEYGGYASQKLDGVWAALVVSDAHGSSVRFVSSSGEHIVAMDDTTAFKEAREHLPAGVYIGELYHPDLPQKDISGISRKKKVGHGEQLQFYMHDIIELDDYAAGKATESFADRLHGLRHALFPPESNHVFERLFIIPQEFCATEDELKAFEAKLPKTAEGAIFKPDQAEWEIGNRGINVIRIKRTLTFDLLVTGVSEVDRTEKGGLTGGIIVLWRKHGFPGNEAEDQLIRGMKHEDLLAWADDPSLIKGKIVEVEAMNITPLGYLREPRFKQVRLDKFEADL